MCTGAPREHALRTSVIITLGTLLTAAWLFVLVGEAIHLVNVIF